MVLARLLRRGRRSPRVRWLAPVWMQIVHLLLADVVWINRILLAATAFAQAEPGK